MSRVLIDCSYYVLWELLQAMHKVDGGMIVLLDYLGARIPFIYRERLGSTCRILYPLLFGWKGFWDSSRVFVAKSADNSLSTPIFKAQTSSNRTTLLEVEVRASFPFISSIRVLRPGQNNLSTF